MNQLSSLLPALVNQASAALNTGVEPKRMGNAHPSIAPYETFTALNGTFVIAGPDRSSTQISNPITLSRTPARYRLVPPDIGGHQGAHWLPTEGK